MLGHITIINSHEHQGTQRDPISSKKDHVTEKTEDVESNADTGYDTNSIASASSSSQITKVRQTWWCTW